jgi:hypothetical protein
MKAILQKFTKLELILLFFFILVLLTIGICVHLKVDPYQTISFILTSYMGITAGVVITVANTLFAKKLKGRRIENRL